MISGAQVWAPAADKCTIKAALNNVDVRLISRPRWVSSYLITKLFVPSRSLFITINVPSNLQGRPYLSLVKNDLTAPGPVCDPELRNGADG
jgi:hypothetical protein